MSRKLKTCCWFAPPLLLLALLLQCPLSLEAKPKQPLPVAVEARFKERITAKLTTSLESAAAHLAKALGLGNETEEAEKRGKKGRGDVFGPYYELNLDKAGSANWLYRCDEDINEEGDSVSHCATRKLHALAALCEVGGVATFYRAGVMRLLRQLVQPRDTIVAGLGIKRSLLPMGQGIEAWLSEMSLHSGNYDVVVPVHGAAMHAVAQCSSVLNETDIFANVHAWFAGMQRTYTQNTWKQNSFHHNAILWESFALISTLVRKGSSFADDLEGFLKDFEAYMLKEFEEKKASWSYSSARASVLAWSHAKKASRRKAFGKAVDEHMQRWKMFAPKLNPAEAYTCGPLQGLAPLLLKRGSQAAELVSSVLKLAEKDVDLFQVSGLLSQEEGKEDEGARSIAAARLGLAAKAGPRGAELEGAFLRDEAQLKGEKRRSLRIDDTAQCVTAMWRTLQLLDDLVGVEVEEQEGQASATPASTSTSASEQTATAAGGAAAATAVDGAAAAKPAQKKQKKKPEEAARTDL